MGRRVWGGGRGYGEEGRGGGRVWVGGEGRGEGMGRR